MASTSNRHVEGTAGRIKTASSNIFNDNQALVGEIRKVSTMIKGVAVDLEKENRSQMVKELEDAVIELLKTSNDCAHFSSAVQTVGNSYLSILFSPLFRNLTDFKKLFDEEETKTKAANPLNLQNNSSLHQFREAIWNVHHAGQPMPGDEQEDIVMTSTQTSILNITCPVSGKPITELQDPVRRFVMSRVSYPELALRVQ
ncbi:E3 SUMO-protein ligase MMS21-like [Papaver somniferum]|uniref:E3 SUMO-protein ligase MMS21-like n=1 Tax=Papaver somniferum TaxID=3469 RepID=UPI000E70457C|nr:E3 SUMO-protein ligase MMS21-like [Papaver somniferum]